MQGVVNNPLLRLTLRWGQVDVSGVVQYGSHLSFVCRRNSPPKETPRSINWHNFICQMESKQGHEIGRFH